VRKRCASVQRKPLPKALARLGPAALRTLSGWVRLHKEGEARMHVVWLLQWSGGARATVPSLVAASGPFAKVVLVVLLIMSVYSWAVIWNRIRLYARVERADR